MLIVWYPATGRTVGPRDPWIPRLWADSAASDLSTFTRRVQPPLTAAEIASLVAATRSFAADSAAVAPAGGPFPVLVFSPGNAVMPSYYASLAEELASYGYVVIGHVPTGYARSVTLPDGRVLPRQPFDNIDTWIGDLRFIVDHVSSWNRDPQHPLHGRLDTLRVGLFGHSGGANAAEVMTSSDPRVKALAAIDPGVTELGWATAKPTLILSADWGNRAASDTAVADMLRERIDFRKRLSNGFAITIAGAQHMSFTDLSAISRLQLGPSGLQQLEASRRVLLAFFNEALLGVHSDLIRTGDSSSRFILATPPIGS